MLLKKAERRYRLRTSDYARLAAFRVALRGFLRFSEDASGVSRRKGEAAGHGEPHADEVALADIAHTVLLGYRNGYIVSRSYPTAILRCRAAGAIGENPCS